MKKPAHTQVFLKASIVILFAGILIIALGSQTSPVSGSQTASSSPASTASGNIAAILPPGSLLASSDGVYAVRASGAIEQVLRGTEIRKIVKAGSGWYFLGIRGVLYSSDLVNFSERNSGFPVKTIKTWDEGQKGFIKEVQEIKDLKADPFDPNTLVACTKDEIFVSRDGGKSWRAIPSPATQPGLKSVAITTVPEELVFVSHPIRGPFVRPINGGSWTEIGGNLLKSDPGTGPDEIADIVVEALDGRARIWAVNSFLHGVYSYNFSKKTFEIVYKTDDEFFGLDSISPGKDSIRYLSDGSVLRLQGSSLQADSQTTNMLKKASVSVNEQLNSVWFPAGTQNEEMSFSELWLIDFKNTNPWRSMADRRHGFYLHPHYMMEPELKTRYEGIMSSNNLDMVVIDMKDDFGRLRYESKDPLVRSIGRTVNPLDIESFSREMKAKGRYLVARIVVFKDQRMYEHAGGIYAAWDTVENRPWRGYENVRREVEIAPPPGAPPSTAAPATETVTERQYYEEYWVDPYSEKVWEYNIAVAREVLAMGFDEVQFDYIRFPTDGTNLGNVSWRWRDAGMDKESALMSFLHYAREHIDAPISIDIYGANGWYRSGVRTGQDVELLARYVDAICPMFYPSHFEQSFMAFPPAEQRPFRIYYIGTLRNSFIARKKSVIRPYAQAFYLNVSYDRQWYSPRYIKLQVDGVRAASNEGLTFWNNAGNYGDLPVLEKSRDGRLSIAPTARGILD